jgi:Dolichyl-phosphate-mannose-protein mannosyltransferase
LERSDYRALASLLAAYVAALLTYRPFADLTYGADDFAYAWSAERLVRDGELVASSWVAAAAVPQLFWAGSFCKVFGFSYRVLNVSTMVLGALSPLLIYCLARELGVARRYAWLTAFFGVVTPYLGFSSSFMTDTYYEVLMLGAALLYARALRRQRLGYWLGGSAVASVAILERQIGIVTPGAAVGALLIGVVTARRSVGRGAWEALLAVSLPALVAVAFRLFPDVFGGVTPTQLVKLSDEALAARFVDHGATLEASYTMLAYLGALLVPFVVACLPAFRDGLRVLDSLGAWLLAGALLAASLTGLGYAAVGTLRVRAPGEFLHPQSLPPLDEPLWYVLVVLGSFALPLVAAAFLVGTQRSLRRSAKSLAGDTALPQLFLLLALAGHGGLVVTFISFFNNYFLPLLPLLLLPSATLLPVTARPVADYRQWPLPAAAALFSFAWSTLSLDAMFRYVEADHRFTETLLAGGKRSHKVFNYMGGFARRNYDRSDAAIKKNPWRAFTKMRRRVRYLVIPTGGTAAPFVKLKQTVPYQTLTGTRTLELRERDRKALSKRKKAHARKKALRAQEAERLRAQEEESLGEGGGGPE